MEIPRFKTLSIVIPVFNEERYLETVISRVISQPLTGGLERELILVNDASKDRTWEIMQTLPSKFPGTQFHLINKSTNEGKGAALRDGFTKVTGDLVIIQDADLEYDPTDYLKLLKPILDGKADVVFGSRFIGEAHRVMYFWHQLANNVLTLLSNMLTNLNLTDMEVGYKVFVREVIDQIQIKSPRFGVEPEIVAKVARIRLNGKRVRVYETGISYSGRTYEEGKKIGWKDAVSAIFQIIRFKFEGNTIQKEINTPSLSNTKFRVRWELGVVLLALGLFVGLAGYNIKTPGLYYDELLFVNAALGGKINMFIYMRLGKLPVMLMPYIGALKAWIYYPIFKIFGVTAYSIRWPVVAIGTLTLWINYRFVKLTFSRLSAFIFILLAAVEPSTLFQTRLDWGPTVLMMFFRALLLLSVFAWIKTEKPWFLLAAGAVSVLGAFDKLNFIWFVSGAAISLMMVYPDRIIAYVRSHWQGAIVVLSLGVMGVSGFLIYTYNHLPLGGELGISNWALRWEDVKHLLQLTIGGIGVYNFVIGDGRALAVQQLLVLIFATIIAVIVLVFTRRKPCEWRALGFIFCFSFFVLVQLFFTISATGPHHTAMIAPLWLIPISVLLERAFDSGKSKGWILKGAAIIAIVGVAVSSLSIDLAYLKGFKGTIEPRWDAGSYNLVNVIKSNQERPVICVDWGSGTIVYGLLNGKVNIYDYWSKFKNGLTMDETEYFEKSLLPQNPIFVVPAAGKETFPETRKHFFEIAADRGWDLVRFSEIRGQSGDVLYELYSVTDVKEP